MRPANRDGFTIAIICALTLEADAVEALFDETYDRFSTAYGQDEQDYNAYITGRLGQHHVVLCYLPSMGKRSAAAAAASLRMNYKRIELALVVGICGAVPFASKDTEIVLGDVIISNSVIEYDFGRQKPDGFCRKGNVKEALGRPNPRIRALLAGLEGQATRVELEGKIDEYLQGLQEQPDTGWQHPGADHDVLFESSYRHKHHSSDLQDKCCCFNCHSSNDPVCDNAEKKDCMSLGCDGSIIHRNRHATGETSPRIHIGTIACADTVMKSGEHRDRIAEKEGVIGFEMEGAGVWDNLPCIIVKGVCDYADSHKNKLWQKYAAATAACCVKGFLEYWLPVSSESSITQVRPSNIASILRKYYTSARRLQIQRISGELLEMEQCYINLSLISEPQRESSQSSPHSLFFSLQVATIDKESQVLLQDVFKSREMPDGRTVDPRRILIHGRAGVGKTTLCKKIMHEHLHHGMWRELFDFIVWIPLRRLKSQSSHIRTLEELLQDLYFSQLPKGEGEGSAGELEKMLLDPSQARKILLILDGLDEVSREWESETAMNNLLLRLLDHPSLITTSRPYGASRLCILSSFDLELETVGFREHEVEAYVKTIYKRDLPKADSILKYLQYHKLIARLVRIPIQLDAVCYSWDRDFILESAPKTMTSLYQAVTLKLWQKDLLRLGKSDTYKQVNENTVSGFSSLQIQDFLPVEINLLERLAFTGICNEIVEFNVDHRHRLYDLLKSQGVILPDAPEVTLQKISFLHTSNMTGMDLDQSFHFLHLTFQEFFAARYFAAQWIKKEQLICTHLRTAIPSTTLISPQSFLQDHKYVPRYNIMWRFVSGLIQTPHRSEQNTGAGEGLRQFFDEIESEPHDLLGQAHPRLLLHCLTEVIPDSNEACNLSMIEDQIFDWLLYEVAQPSHTFFADERDCPEHILLKILRAPSKNLIMCGLYAFRKWEPLPLPVVEAYLQLLKHDDEHVVEAVVHALSLQSQLPPAILQAMFPLTVEGDHPVLFGKLWQHISIYPEICTSLIPHLKDDRGHVRLSTAAILAQQPIPPSGVLEALLDFLQDPRPKIRYGTAIILSLLEELAPIAIEALLPLLEDDEYWVRRSAVETLGKQPILPPLAVKAILSLTKDVDWSVRGAALTALNKHQSLTPGVLETIIPLIGDPNWLVRRSFIELLGDQPILMPEILEVLVHFLTDEDLFVRSRVIDALMKRSPTLPPAVVESLLPLLQDSNLEVRRNMMNLLGQQQALSVTAVGALEHSQSILNLLDHEHIDRPPPLSTEDLAILLPLLDQSGTVADRAVEILGRQPSLPPPVVDTFVEILALHTNILPAYY
ncbi:hypothetical protein BJX70DRAFT_403877 [Aspergillus crustosus]